jgi:hypothetical protein
MRDFEGGEMKNGNTSRREYWLLAVAGTGLMLLTGAGAFWLKANADRSQPTLEMAVNEDPAAPVHGFAWNDAVGDLLQSLPPDLAIEVCASLSNGAGRPAPQPCAELREIAAIAPAASGAMAEAADERISMPTINQLPAEVPASYAMATVPPSPPTRASMPEIDAESGAVVPEPAPVTSKVAAALGAQIAAAQTTQTDLEPAPRGEKVDSALPSGAPQAQTLPPAAIMDDATIVHGLLLTTDSRQTANESGGVSAESASKEAALEAAEAAKTQAQAKARARAAAEAKAKAAARARAKAAARARARENALRGSREDNGDSDGGDSKADGKGRGGSSGEGGRD